MDGSTSDGTKGPSPREKTSSDKPGGGNVERFIRVTYEKLPAQTKVLVSLFSALNTVTTLTRDFELPDSLWQSMLFNDGGPLVGESEEVNWLKGICDGILLIANHA
ncbi:hypothetical protein [Anaerobaca lacustris]|uniref:Uncharacterized protein n=1 Tax=Anaerobaca lacustris TaxID=3044600 RepID=A0AAW6U1I5_9BACT|nr:hypothetical protein [Sedimentisphaerales bacterium M17dextr]